MRGAWDLHCHCYPELTLGFEARQDDAALVRAVEVAGMSGLVLKSHFWPTPSRAFYLQRLAPGIQVLSSITLNGVAGGLSPLAVEAAARLGARVVWFPTWQARHDLNRGGMSNHVRGLLPLHGAEAGEGLEVAAGGRLTAEAEAVLDVAQAFRLVVCTGHVSPAEGLLLCAGARRRGLQAVFTHPLAATVGASLEEMRAAAELGAYLEACVLHFTLSLRPHPRQRVLELVAAVGAEHCLLTTDTFNPWVPPAPELLRLGVGMLREEGMSEADLRRLIADNPRRILEG